MNKAIIIGRLTKAPESKHLESKNVSRFTLAVDRLKGEADFISCVAFGKLSDFAEGWLHKGTKVALTGRIKTGSYTNKEGVKIYTTDIVAESIEFCESKGATPQEEKPQAEDGFADIPDQLDPDLPFH